VLASSLSSSGPGVICLAVRNNNVCVLHHATLYETQSHHNVSHLTRLYGFFCLLSTRSLCWSPEIKGTRRGGRWFGEKVAVERRISVDIGCTSQRQGKEVGREGVGSGKGEQSGPYIADHRKNKPFQDLCMGR